MVSKNHLLALQANYLLKKKLSHKR